jgi:type III pantothenate kinase
MLICIDVGNTHTALGLLDGLEVRQHWRVSTDERRTADEWAVLLSGLLSGLRTGLPTMMAAGTPVGVPADGIALCSTVPMVLHEMRQMLAQYFANVPQVVIEPGVRTGVPVLMDNPREVGTDRIINALAASHLYPGPGIVVDFGTATTFDVVSGKGEYVGGAIAPGIEISLEALGQRGAQLRKVELLRPRAVIAKNTVEALQSGVVYGFAGQVDGIVARMVSELAVSRGDVTVIGTGGLAAVVLAECTSIDVYEPLLTLMGLRLAFDRVLSTR